MTLETIFVVSCFYSLITNNSYPKKMDGLNKNNFNKSDGKIPIGKTETLFTQETPKTRRSPFFYITILVALGIVAFLLYKGFAKSIIGTASNISSNYDTNTVKEKEGKIQCIDDDTDTCDATKVGSLRYRSDSNNSYVDMCMQDGASSYTWKTIDSNTW